LCNVVNATGPIKVEFEDGNINLLAEDRSFGEVLDAMAKTVSFTVKVPPELRSKKISIRMYNTELDRAVTRLFSLVQEKNYKVKFDSSGKITNLEVISGKSLRRLPKAGKAENEIVKKREARRSKSRRFSPRRRPSRRYKPREVPPPEPVVNQPPPVVEELPPEIGETEE
jgi:type II secretory pathway component GspD/PulD (secretin)